MGGNIIMQQRHTITTISAAQTQKVGQRLARRLRGGEVLALVGDLGAGKTVLARGIAQGLGIKHRIVSPTFILMRVYPVRRHKKIRRLVHVDAYRIKHANDLLAIGLGDYLGKPDTVSVIEWADRVKKILPQKTVNITFRHGNTSSQRTIMMPKALPR